MDLRHRIADHIKEQFKFKQVGEWFQQGICPKCNEKELYVRADNPRVVKCNRKNNCGYEEHVKEICSELFKEWSKDYPRTTEKPNAAADAYLQEMRGFDIKNLVGLYTQETFHHETKYPGLYSATVRFKIADKVYWERLIDRPERFGKQKANIVGKIGGLYWTYHTKFDDLCISKEVWITEGIFNSIALSLSKITSAASLSTNNYPTQLLAQIKKRCEELGLKTLPTIIWAFDADVAGIEATKEFHDRAVNEGWKCSAALPSNYDGSLDWNDLYERGHLNDQEQLKRFKHYGQLCIAKTAREAGVLIFNFYNNKNNFSFVHDYKTYWFSYHSETLQKEIDTLKESVPDVETAKQKAIKRIANVEKICDAKLKGLYLQRDPISQDAFYYFKIQLDKRVEYKATFSPEQLTSKNNFKNRLLSIAPIFWSGSESQLQKITEKEMNHKYLKEVRTIDFIGYSKEHRIYVFNQHAVYKGKVININKQDFFTAGKTDIKSLSTNPAVHLTDKAFDPSWWRDNYKINGEKGLIILAWWTGTYFAEQIREKHSSYPFMEYVGQAGSGKSSLIDFLWRLSGRFDAKEGINPNSSSIVAVHRYMAQLANLPVVFIEGDRKNGDKQARQKFDWDELKDAYNGQNIRTRGLKTSGNETYEPPFRGAIMISQNDPMQATEAILSRTLQICVDMQGHTYEKKIIANRLYGIEKEQAATYMTHCLKNEEKILKTFFEKFAEIEKDLHQKGITHTRIALCHAQVSAMIEAIAKHVLQDVIDLEEIIDSQTMLENMGKKRMEDLNDDHIFVKQFWDAYEYIDSTLKGSFKLNHYGKNDEFIAINLNEVYKLAARNYQSMPDINEMRTLLKSSRKYKFKEMNKAVRSDCFPADEVARVKVKLGERIVKCWIFSNPYFVKKG